MKNQFRTLKFNSKPSIISTYSVVGPKEKGGHLGKFFDMALDDDRFGESTYEKAESKMLSTAIKKVVKKAGYKEDDVGVMIAGDLLNQIISASFSARDFDIPFLGLYNACATVTESLIVGSMMVDGSYVDNAVLGAVSHFATAERQYRYPLELGSVRPPQSQWTVTGCGSYFLSKNRKNCPIITSATIGKVIDFGVTDANNMGAAMAPAACSTISLHLKSTKTKPEDYDLILTGDLGALGSRIVKHLLKEQGINVDLNHVDCGELIYNMDEKVFQGGSGAGCSASVFASYIYPKLKSGEINRVLFAATGALLSTVSSQQGESIPGICHAVCVESNND